MIAAVTVSTMLTYTHFSMPMCWHDYVKLLSFIVLSLLLRSVEEVNERPAQQFSNSSKDKHKARNIAYMQVTLFFQDLLVDPIPQNQTERTMILVSKCIRAYTAICNRSKLNYFCVQTPFKVCSSNIDTRRNLLLLGTLLGNA